MTLTSVETFVLDAGVVVTSVEILVGGLVVWMVVGIEVWALLEI